MKRAYINGILLDGTQHMEPQAHKVLLCEDGTITALADEGVDLDGYEVIDLHGGYLCPGLINLHVHLAGNGTPSAKPRDNAALVRKILSNALTRAVAYRLVCSYAKLELLGGVTPSAPWAASQILTPAAGTMQQPASCWHPVSLPPTRASRCRAATWQARWPWQPITTPKHWRS